MVKAAFNKKNLFNSILDSDLGKKLVKCYIWGIDLCGAGTWDISESRSDIAGNFNSGPGEGWRRSVGPIV
jgi:hypothetical protein